MITWMFFLVKVRVKGSRFESFSSSFFSFWRIRFRFPIFSISECKLCSVALSTFVNDPFIKEVSFWRLYLRDGATLSYAADKWHYVKELSRSYIFFALGIINVRLWTICACQQPLMLDIEQQRIPTLLAVIKHRGNSRWKSSNFRHLNSKL